MRFADLQAAQKFDYVGAALRPLGPVTALLMNDGQNMIIDLERPPQTRFERLCLKGAMMRAGRLVRAWKLVDPPRDFDPSWVQDNPTASHQLFLVVDFGRSLSGNEIARFRSTLGLRYPWHGLPNYQEGDYCLWVAFSTVVRGIPEADKLPEPDFETLAHIDGVLSVGWAPHYPHRVIEVESRPGHHVLDVARNVCEAAGAYLDIGSYHPPEDWDLRGLRRDDADIGVVEV